LSITAPPAINLYGIPEALKDARRWVVHRSKVPYRAASPSVRASSTNPTTWAAFGQAVAAWQQGDADGIGYVLGDSIAGIDVDHAIDDAGNLKPEAAAVLDLLPDTYTEISPSGRGLHAYVYGTKTRGKGCKAELGNGCKLEVYDAGRYFTCTGHTWANSPVSIAEADLFAICELLPDDKPSNAPRAVGGGFTGDDAELIDKARKASNGGKFSRLFDAGDLSEHSGDASRGDLALCCLLAWWTAGDAERIDRLFERSALYRDKWQRDDYRDDTIRKAIELCSGKYYRPEVGLPSNGTEIIDTGRELGQLLAAAGHYTRGGKFARINGRTIELPDVAQCRSIFESVARLGVYTKADDGTRKLEPRRCSKDNAEAVVKCDQFRNALPPINAVAHCPILDDAGEVVTGYHEPSGVYAFGDKPNDVPLDEARKILLGMLADFAFVTEHDHARAMACVLTPALAYSGLLGDAQRTPAAYFEADRSQSGKGYAVRCIAATYNTIPAAVSQRVGGVGSIEESISAHLIAASPLIALDNLRGKISLPWFESVMTEPTADCRTPYSKSITLDPTRTAWAITSNRAEMTPDLANRCCVVRITKQAEGYKYRDYPAGDLLEDIRANQTRYLGAVYAVVRAWLKAGKPGGNDGRHDMRRWAGAIGYMVRDLIGLADPLTGHRELQQRTANTSANWMRDVCIAVADAGKCDHTLHAHDLLDVLLDAEIEVPGIKKHDDPENENTRTKGLRGIGRRLKSVFSKLDNPLEQLPVDAFEVERISAVDPNDERRWTHSYVFRKSARPQDLYNEPHSDSQFEKG